MPSIVDPIFRSPSAVPSIALVAALLAADVARAGLVDSYVVGSGALSSFVQVEFANRNAYLYEVRYDDAGTGRDLFAIIAAAQPGHFAFETIEFSFGSALYGILIGADADAGFGTPPEYLDYWHYWTREAGDSAWTESWTGFADRSVSDGSWDGWVFGAGTPPVAVPAPGSIALLAAGAAAGARRRRR